MTFGGLELSEDGSKVANVGALQTIFTLSALTEDAVAASKAWEARLEEYVLGAEAAKFEHIDVYVRTENLIDKVVEEVAMKDRWIFPFGFGLMLLYTCVAQALSSDAGSRGVGVALGAVGVLYVAASVVTALALSAALTIITPARPLSNRPHPC